MIKIKLILPPHQELAALAETTFKEHNKLYKSDYSEEYELEIEQVLWVHADQLTFDADVIISRGIFSNIIKDNINSIPIVDIPFTGSDLLGCLDECKKRFVSKKIAILGPSNVIYDVEKISDIVGLQVKPCGVERLADIELMVNAAANEGYQIIVGGLLTKEYATKMGLEWLFLPTGKETMWHAITEAKRVAQISRREQEKAELFKTILDYAYEGVIAVDKKKQISAFNMAAQKILDIDMQNPIGKKLDQILSKSNLREMLIDKNKHLGTIISHNKVQLAVNKVPIMLKGENVGDMVTFEDITKIQDMEEKIRKEIHRRGHIAKYTFQDIVGDTKILKEVIQTAKSISPVDSNILIIGETGTGKELFAQSIHNHSLRKKGPFVAVNCAALPENLLESELFGYVEGAFTGASKGGKAGLFELAHKGTIFLDEIGEISLNLQSRLLRVIEEKEIMRLGHDRVMPIDVRIISATNKDLYTMVKSATFREDLYYRLNVLKLDLPSLVERKDDILLLARNFVMNYAKQFKKPNLIFTEGAKKVLQQIEWPGNIRELRNICERLVVLSKSNMITEENVWEILDYKKNREHINKISSINMVDQTENYALEEQAIEKTKGTKLLEYIDDIYIEELKNQKRMKLQNLLEQEGFNKAKVAEKLGVNRSTLWRWMKELEMS